MMTDYADALNADTVTACADLVGRSGASQLELGYLHEDVPIEAAGWYATAHWRGTRISVSERRSPSEAALALAEKLLIGAICRCGKVITLSDRYSSHCRWQLTGARWEPGCDTPPIHVDAPPGDLAAVRQAMEKAHPHLATDQQEVM